MRRNGVFQASVGVLQFFGYREDVDRRRLRGTGVDDVARVLHSSGVHECRRLVQFGTCACHIACQGQQAVRQVGPATVCYRRVKS